MPGQSSRHIPSGTRAVETDELRDLVGSVFILGLPEGSDARALAVRAADDATSYLRGKTPFKRAAEQLVQISPAPGAGFRLRQDDGTLTAAGAIVEAWLGSSADRTSLFDEQGATGRTLLVLDIDGIDMGSFWSDSEQGGPRITRGGPDASLTLFETAPALVARKRPDGENGVIQTLSGQDVSVKRRGNTSRWDSKPNFTVLLDDDVASGFPKQLNLTNCIRDPAYQRIRIAWSLFDEARCPVQPNAYAEVTLNGHYKGTYVALAPIDKHFFRQWFPKWDERATFRGQYGDDIAGGATLEKRGESGQDYFGAGVPEGERTYEARLGTEDQRYADLAQFISRLHQFPDPSLPAFADAMEQMFDVASFLRAMAVINLLGSWDCYYLNAQNYFLHMGRAGRDTERLRVGFCPYDQDSVLGVSWPPQKRNWQDKDLLFRGKERGKLPLVTRILENGRFRNYYLDFMNWFTLNQFTDERIAEKRDQLWKTLEQSVYLEADTPHGQTSTERPWTNHQVYLHAVQDQQLDVTDGAVAGLQVTGIGKFVEARRAKVLRQLNDQRLGASQVDFASENWQLP